MYKVIEVQLDAQEFKVELFKEPRELISKTQQCTSRDIAQVHNLQNHNAHDPPRVRVGNNVFLQRVPNYRLEL